MMDCEVSKEKNNTTEYTEITDSMIKELEDVVTPKSFVGVGCVGFNK